ncbi:FHA domain-containing protein [Xylanimonas allomyrinae]|uniref:FHA domain-containing protein n=1 Tax=Xylanimonas allomyrinae TaxID=2509459 RepID=A0A4P6ELM4_9MICO|nr:FHA domain-containing protein [Xylanimonas allomyrinae]QAY62169.1 FHA domain-containing protein [Xylanimonas allomyrinae]
MPGSGAVVWIVACWTAVVVVALVHLWYAAGLARLFRAVGGEPWRAWVPFANEAEVCVCGGEPWWTALLMVVPGVNLYAVVVRARAAHRIGAKLGRGGGATALAVLLPPVWAHVAAGSRPAERAQVARTASPAALPVPVGPVPVGPVPVAPVPVGPAPSLPAPMTPVPAIDASQGGAPATVAAARPLITAPPGVQPMEVLPSGSRLTGTAAASAVPAWAPTAPPTALPPVPASPPVLPPVPAPPTVLPPVPAPPPVLPPVTHPQAPVPTAPAPGTAQPAPAPAPGAAGTGAALPTRASLRAAAAAAQVGGGVEPAVSAVPVAAPAPGAERWVLVFDDGRVLPLKGAAVVLGRRPEAVRAGDVAVALADASRTLSKVHARLERVGDGWVLTDLGSTNGSRVAGPDGRVRAVPASTPTPVPGRFELGDLGLEVRRA